MAATSSLLEVTTDLPFSRQLRTKVYAGSRPPMHSTTMVTSGSSRITLKSFVKLPTYGSSGNSLRSRICFTLISSLARRVMLSVWVKSTSSTPEPTTPWPNTAISAMFLTSQNLFYAAITVYSGTSGVWSGGGSSVGSSVGS